MKVFVTAKMLRIAPTECAWLLIRSSIHMFETSKKIMFLSPLLFNQGILWAFIGQWRNALISALHLYWLSLSLLTLFSSSATVMSAVTPASLKHCIAIWRLFWQWVFADIAFLTWHVRNISVRLSQSLNLLGEVEFRHSSSSSSFWQSFNLFRANS